MIELVISQNGEIYDRLLSGSLTIKKARAEFAALSRLLIRSKVEPKVVGVIEELGKAWKELAEREYIAEQKAKAKDKIKNHIDFDVKTPESIFLYK